MLLKGIIYEFVFLGCFASIFLAFIANPEYFFPYWIPQFPPREELLEISGRLGFNTFAKTGSTFVIWRGSHRTFLVCQHGYGSWSRATCSDYGIPKHLDWKKSTALYHPQWGLIELVVDGYKVPSYTYEDRKSSVERSGKEGAYMVMFSSLLIFCYLLRDIQLYWRRRRSERLSSTEVKMDRKITRGN
jgi:hypothetical protein